MNYLAHGHRFVDRPLFMAGTAVPDWLSVADRGVRVRSRHVLERRAELSGEDQEIADGILQHLRDDDAFHRCPTFVMLESELGHRFRQVMPDPFDHRPGFLGHILVEILLDGVIAERDPQILSRYYQAMSTVDSEQVQRLVSRVALRPTERLAGFIRAFQRERFLFDYQDNHRLRGRLNQVLQRVTLPVMDETYGVLLSDARSLVRQHADALLSSVACSDEFRPVTPADP